MSPPPIPIWRRYARFFGMDLAADVDDELTFHLEQKTDDLIAAGLTPADARREARRQFGDFGAIRESGRRTARKKERQMKLRDRLNSLFQDLHYALRTLLGVPRDEMRALAYYAVAAEGGDPIGQTNLGARIDSGQAPVSPLKLTNFATATRFYRLAAAQGHRVAQYNLGGTRNAGWGA